jgi:hypothetical protein
MNLSTQAKIFTLTGYGLTVTDIGYSKFTVSTGANIIARGATARDLQNLIEGIRLGIKIAGEDK